MSFDIRFLNKFVNKANAKLNFSCIYFNVY